MRDLLSRGIGVHHGGLLPLVKEARLMFIINHGCTWVKPFPGGGNSVCSGVGEGLIRY